MATPPSSSASSNRPPSGSGATSSGGTGSGGSSRKERPKPISVKIQPTIGPCFSLCLLPTTKIASMKETISDRMGLSPQKMTLLLHNNELVSGTLSSNNIEDGTEIRLVPAVESGVTTTNSVDPVAMMKHSMSGISDQQIDDFLNGKSPLSVAIRVGESVVVVNLHRAKVEEIEVEPPPTKRRCMRARRPSSEETDSPRSSPAGSSSSRHLNTNTCSSTEELMDTSEHLAAPSSMRRRASSRYMDHSSIRTGHDRHSNPSPNNTITTPSPIVVGESSTAASSSGCRSTGLGGVHPHSLGDARPPCVADTSSHLTRSTTSQGASGGSMGSGAHSSSTTSPMTISNLLKSSASSPSVPSPVSSCYSPITSPASSVGSLMPHTPPNPRDFHKSAYYHRHPSRKVPEGYKLSPTGNTQGNGKPSPKGQGSSKPTKSTDSSKPCSSNSHRARTVSRSVQTDPESSGSTSRGREERESSGRRAGSKREMKLPDSGVNMKRKAVMEAISEILKKMYANSDKGRLPGSFKGRFSSEFTCDSDMSEILHSKTTMTSYNSEMEEMEKSPNGHAHSSVADPALVSKAKYEENEQLRDKVAQLKWKMQHRRAIKMAKRKGERSPCGWMEALNCNMPGSPPTARERTGYAGMKRGFLLSD